MISWKVFVGGFFGIGGVISLTLLLVQFKNHQAKSLGHFTVQTDQLAQLIKLSENNLEFQWLEKAESIRGISVYSTASPSTLMLNAVAEEKSGKTWISLYPDQNYKERLQIDPIGARVFINTHLIQAYLLSQHEAENLADHFQTFCQTDCRLEHWSVVQ